MSPAPAVLVREDPRQRQSVRETLRRPGRLRTELLAGLVVGLALIPEAIAFSVIAGVDPRAGLFASFVMAVTTAILGGRPAMVSAATGAVALVIAPVAREHGEPYLYATVILAGLMQVVLAALRVPRLMRFVPRSVMLGFVNSLAILVFAAQLPELIGVPWAVYPLTALGLLIVVGLPRLTRAVPSALMSIVIVTGLSLAMGLAVPSVGDKGALPESLPVPGLPQVPLTLETLRIIAPYALGMAVVGLMESLLTAKLVDDITDTRSDKVRESWAQGAANGLTGLLGGIGGCAVIGQTMINVRAGGARTRLSTAAAGIFLLLLVVVLGDAVALIPMASLVAVMIFVSATTFDWHSVAPSRLRRMPLSETLVMAVTMAATLISHNLAVGVVLGVLTAMVAFAQQVAHLVDVRRELVPAGEGADQSVARYTVTGELFFASSNDLYMLFDYAGDPPQVIIDAGGARLWDASAVAAFDSVLTKYEEHGKHAQVRDLEPGSRRMRARLSER